MKHAAHLRRFTMTANFRSTSGFSRLAVVLAACVITVSLFGAVAFGLTGTDVSAVPARGSASPVTMS
jgi:hypothetical protein